MFDKKYSEHFGFTEQEVLRMMSYYEVENRFPTMKEWYDGYLFGDTQAYKPWSVAKFLYVKNLLFSTICIIIQKNYLRPK